MTAVLFAIATEALRLRAWLHKDDADEEEEEEEAESEEATEEARIMMMIVYGIIVWSWRTGGVDICFVVCEWESNQTQSKAKAVWKLQICDHSSINIHSLPDR